MKSWPVRELKYHKVGQHKAYWPVSIMHLKVGHQTPKQGRSKNARIYMAGQDIVETGAKINTS